MLREDGTTYLSVLEVKNSISLNGNPITATPTVTGSDVSIDPTGLTNITATEVQALIVEIDPLLGGGGGETEIKRKTTTVTELANLADYIGEWYLIAQSPVAINTLNKMSFQLSFNTTGSVTVDLKLIDNLDTLITYNNGYSTVNAEATVNLNSGATVYDFIVDKFIQANGISLYMKVNNTNLSDPLKVLEISKEVTVTTTTQNVYIQPGV